METHGISVFILMAVIFISMSSPEVTAYYFYKCKLDTDCSDDDVCYRNRCTNACELRNSNKEISACGFNTFCLTTEPHTAVCVCQDFHTGNPDLGCIKESEADEYYRDLEELNNIEYQEYLKERYYI